MNTDLVLLDIKYINADWHKSITRTTNATTLRFAKHLKDTDTPIWFRYVLVPGYSDQEEYMHEMGQYFKDYTKYPEIRNSALS